MSRGTHGVVLRASGVALVGWGSGNLGIIPPICTLGCGRRGRSGSGTGSSGTTASSEGGGNRSFSWRRASATLESMIMDENVRTTRPEIKHNLLQPIVPATKQWLCYAWHASALL